LRNLVEEASQISSECLQKATEGTLCDTDFIFDVLDKRIKEKEQKTNQPKCSKCGKSEYTCPSPQVIKGKEEEMKEWCAYCVNVYHFENGGELVENNEQQENSN